MNEIRKISEPSNGGKASIATGEPYVARIKLRGVADMLLHRWNNEAVAAKAAAAKNSRAKKTDDLESYVYRADNGNLGIPGEYVRQSIIGAAKFRQDPRSPRKSAQDLFKAGIVPLTELADLKTNKWDYEDHRRVHVQRNAITRIRPAMRAGWKIDVDLMCNLPEYIDPDLLQDVLEKAGRLIGIADFRPTFGRFAIESFKIQ